jgi:hypothetical protein
MRSSLFARVPLRWLFRLATGRNDVLLVHEIKKGSETMTFRDAKGFPMWAGRGRW